jgi:hypothetical protein
VRGWICSKEEVEQFLADMKKVSTGDTWEKILYIPKETKDGDKTHAFMVAHDIDGLVVFEELLKLDVTNYSKTDYDEHPAFKNEIVWFFGQIFMMEEVYIKVKIRKYRNLVVCLSFHEPEFDLGYPYL